MILLCHIIFSRRCNLETESEQFIFQGERYFMHLFPQFGGGGDCLPDATSILAV
jgi:hypothetical protein